ncbi:MAG: tail fiber protein, partial [Candidatus Hydrogenedentes bacterium]|nr:tail fiber protein [Candidatus Hydrogenedentota bacterium]
MADPFLGEIRAFAGNFAPLGWALCQGQLLPIAQNDALFALIGTTYGGDGQTSFALPNLAGRIPIHQGAGPGLTPRALGEAGGSETVALGVPQLPSHSHVAIGANSGAD